MTGRLRELAERPVSPGVVRAILATALAATAGLGCVVSLGLGAHRRPWVDHDRGNLAELRPDRPAGPPVEPQAPPDDPARRRQDLLDRPGTPAHRRADRELATHRALQHVPWHRGGVSVGLSGAKGAEAILSVSGPTVGTDRRAYRAFLRRFHDDGRSYLPRFEIATGGRP